MPDEPCRHPDFAAFADVGRIVPPEWEGREDDPDAPVIGFSAEFRINCVACGVHFVFFGQGLPVGMLRDRPCISADGQELRVPLRPESGDPHLGLGLGGFQARIAEGMPGAQN